MPDGSVYTIIGSQNYTPKCRDLKVGSNKGHL